MKFGFYLPTRGPTARPGPLAEMASRGDSLGFHSMVMADHIVLPRAVNSTYPYTLDGVYPGAAEGECLEQLTTLAFLAAATRQIRLVPSVMIVPYRNPVVTAKVLATLDVLSNGRVTLGVGVGWMEEEFQALAAPPFADRGEVTNEYLQIFKELWTAEMPSFQGKHYSFSPLDFLPKPVQKPHIPIWVGGQSRRALRRAATLGNGWHPVGTIPSATLEPEELAGDLARMHRYAEEAGRDPGELDVAMKAPLYDPEVATGRRRFSGSPDQLLQDIQTYSDVGVTHTIFDIRSRDLNQTTERMAWFAEEVLAKA